MLLALALALFGARNGASSIVIALNIAYKEKATRIALLAASGLIAVFSTDPAQEPRSERSLPKAGNPDKSHLKGAVF